MAGVLLGILLPQVRLADILKVGGSSIQDIAVIIDCLFVRVIIIYYL